MERSSCFISDLKNIRILQMELDIVAGERNVLVFLMDLLSSRLDHRQVWMDESLMGVKEF